MPEATQSGENGLPVALLRVPADVMITNLEHMDRLGHELRVVELALEANTIDVDPDIAP